MVAKPYTGSYDFSLERQDSLSAGKNFVTLYNPAASGIFVTLTAAFVSYASDVVSPSYTLRGFRIASEPTGGTLHTNSTDVCKFDTAHPDPEVVLRSNNPTVALGAPFFNSPAGVEKKVMSDVHQIDAPPGFNPFLIRPGEGIVFRQAQGAVGHLWNISIIWRELRS